MYCPSSSLISSCSLHSNQHCRLWSRRIPALFSAAPSLIRPVPWVPAQPAPLLSQPKFWATTPPKQGSNQAVNRHRQSTFYLHLLSSSLLILFSTTSGRRSSFLNSWFFYHHPSNHNSVFGTHAIPFWHWVHIRNMVIYDLKQSYFYPV